MTSDEILAASAMPLAARSYPKGPSGGRRAERHLGEVGAARTVPQLNCRAADLPVRNVLFGRHIVADRARPCGEILLDYLA